MSEAKRSRKTGGKDRISTLSDDLLIEILLLVPTKVAVATTVLSKRWRFVWTKLPRLEYKETKNSDSDDLKSNKTSVWWFLDESMRFHNAPLLETLCTKLGPQCPVDVDVVKWVAKAVDRYVRELKFKLSWNSEPISMPNCLYTCKTLTKLTLSNKILVDVPSTVYLPSLTQLELVYVVYKDEDSHVRLLSSCPVLKDLTVLRKDEVDDNVRKFIVEVPSLLRLTYWNAALQDDDADTDRSLVINTTALIHLDIVDGLRYSFSTEYMPHLGKAYIDVSFNPDESFLRSLSSIEYLELTLIDTILPWCNVAYSRLVECSIRCFDRDWCNSLVVLISNCPKLKVFEIDTNFNRSENHVPVLWDQLSYVPKCLLSHLEIFRWNRYKGREDEKEVIRYILGNSKCLKEARFSLNSTCNLEEKQKMIEELESMPRVSTSHLFSP